MPKSRRNHQKKSLKKRQRGGFDWTFGFGTKPTEVDAAKVDTTKPADTTQNSVPTNGSTATASTDKKTWSQWFGLSGGKGRKTSKKKRSKRDRR
jgi:hypothetical protein